MSDLGFKSTDRIRRWFAMLLDTFYEGDNQINFHSSHFIISLRTSKKNSFYYSLSSCLYGTMYSVIVQCNACTFYSLFVWVLILPRPKPKTYLREEITRAYEISFIKFELSCCLLKLNLRKAFHGNLYQKLKKYSNL